MKILITGGTGLIGTALSKELLAAGHQLAYLSRNPTENALGVPEYAWDLKKGTVDLAAFEDCEAIINLAGAPLDQKWTPEYKSTILRSRVDGTRLLHQTVAQHKLPIKSLISASAVGYYPDDLEQRFREGDPPGQDFLSTVCQKWEQEAMHFEQLGIRTVRLRIGLVLSAEGGALPRMAQPARFGLGAALGSGQQWMSWIHIHDLVRIFQLALEEEDISGALNGVGPGPLRNQTFTAKLSKALSRPKFLPPVPKFVLRLIFGEMAQILLASNRVESNVLAQKSFTYQYQTLEQALADLFQS